MSARIESPFPIFTDTDGSPLEDGFLYIGEVSQNPEVVPTTVYWDENLTVPASQPIRTISGYPSRSGTIARVYLDVDYSITIRDKNSSLVSTSANETVDGGIGTIGNFTTATGTVNALELDLPSVAAYADNMILDFQVTGANTGSMTIQINALGTKALVVNNSPIPSDTTIVNGYYSAVYNLVNDNFELINHELGKQIEDVEKIDKSVTQNVASDADITLTADQNLYGRIEITDTGVILTTGRNVITNNIEHTFLFVNSTAQTLTVKTPGGTGIAILTGEASEVRNNTVNVIDYEATIGDIGKVLQEVYEEDRVYGTGTGVIPYDDTIPQITEGSEVLTASITPISATSKLRVDAFVYGGETTNITSWIISALFRDATSDAILAQFSEDSNAASLHQQGFSFSIDVPSNSIVATTFSLRLGGPTAGTYCWNGNGARRLGGAMASYIRITEILT